jgi:hypothetical protein
MKAVIGLLLIFAGGVIDYFVIIGKLPPSGSVTPPPTGPNLPTVSSASNSFAVTTGQGSTSGNTGTYNPPPVKGAGIPT